MCNSATRRERSGRRSTRMSDDEIAAAADFWRKRQREKEREREGGMQKDAKSIKKHRALATKLQRALLIHHAQTENQAPSVGVIELFEACKAASWILTP